ncbi:MAG: hypothetical protein EOO61_13790 [Hymenobacter sp.]|nr:MAG: hypothetical protein EOO61_13790 [Hymenobacter sp.]
MGKYNEESAQPTTVAASTAPTAYYASSHQTADLMHTKTQSKFRLLSKEQVQDKRCNTYEYAF